MLVLGPDRLWIGRDCYERYESVRTFYKAVRTYWTAGQTTIQVDKVRGCRVCGLMSQVVKCIVKMETLLSKH